MRSDAPPGARAIMDGPALRQTVARMAHEIAERREDVGRLALVGIQTRGFPLAQRIAGHLETISGAAPDLGALDIALVRRDASPSGVAVPVVAHVTLEFPIDERDVIIVDDVLFTSRTARAALDALFDEGRPPLVQLAVLIDRGHRELPIRPDYVGREVLTDIEEHVQVRLEELDGADEVLVTRPG